MQGQRNARSGALMITIGLLAAGAGCASDKAQAGPPASAGVAPEKVADMLHAVMEADRTVYTQMVVNRLVKEQKVQVVDAKTGQPASLQASEHWKTETGKLPLPAQMFRMGAEKVAAGDAGFSYVLLSKWPINQQNKAKTEVEKKGLDAVIESQGKKPFYGAEELGGAKYFTAVYADVASAPACVDCHNGHADSPRSDFKVGDVMGAVVIRIPL
jgi:Protein of unknown function (DUF3365)